MRRETDAKGIRYELDRAVYILSERYPVIYQDIRTRRLTLIHRNGINTVDVAESGLLELARSISLAAAYAA